MTNNPGNAAIPSFVKASAPNPDTLARIRSTLRSARDLQLEISDAETSLISKKQQLREYERTTLPDLFNSAGISSLTIEAEGNLPAYEAQRSPYYKANIAASWPPEKKAEAFAWLEKHGGADLIKCQITIHIPRKAAALRKTVLAALRKMKIIDYEIDLAVPWGSLTKFVRECYERRKIHPPLELLGADVGEIVRFKPRNDDYASKSLLRNNDFDAK